MVPIDMLIAGCHKPSIFKAQLSTKHSKAKCNQTGLSALTRSDRHLRGKQGGRVQAGTRVGRMTRESRSRPVLWPFGEVVSCVFLGRNVMIRCTFHLYLQHLVLLFLFCLFMNSMLPLNLLKHYNNEVGLNHCCRI